MGKIIDGVYHSSEGNPAHRGIVEVDGKLYYAGENGEIVKNRTKVVHHRMANKLVEHGTYFFDENGVLDPSSLKKPKKRTTKKKKKSKTAKGTAKAISFFLFGGIILVFLAVFLPDFFQGEQRKTEKTTGSKITVSVPEFEKEIYLCSPAIEKYYKGERTLEQALKSTADPYSAFVFEYNIENADSAVLKLGETKSLSDAVSYKLDPQEKKISIDNLKTGIQYYFKVTATNNVKQKKEAAGSFKTADTNRFVYLKGLYNTRDIGGYETEDHKRIKQGMLIRGTEPDGLVVNNYYLENPKDAKPFGFVCDFDLRNSDIFNANYVSRFGKSVKHTFYDSPAYGNIFAKTNADNLRRIFADLADRGNYPMYLHCTYGADRTGTIIFLLQGLLGVSEEDMLTEYKLTGFFNSSYAGTNKIQPVYSGLVGVPGKTINEKIRNYMVDIIGITEEQIRELRAVLLE